MSEEEKKKIEPEQVIPETEETSEEVSGNDAISKLINGSKDDPAKDNEDKDDKDKKDIKEASVKEGKSPEAKKEPAPVTKKMPEKKMTETKVVFEPLNINKKVVAAIAGAGLLLFLVLFVSFSGLFRVKNVEINGNYAVSDERIMEMAGIEPGDFIFRFDWPAVASRIRSQEPYISNISFHTSFPSGLRIEVEERAKIAYISLPDGYAAVDEDGIVLEFSADYTDRVHPVICGIDTDHAVLGHKLEIRNTRDYQKMIIVLGAVLAADRNNTGAFEDYSFFENLQEVRIIPSGMIFLTIKLPDSTTVQVKLKDIDTITDQMNWLVYVVEEGKLDDLPDGVLDMTGEESIFRPYE
ncbi:MAG: FtsQ-type POTRA domain-containing protein [Clostridiales bacterium]|nr:FtsQ-type POTRA domain-containing protein [Clostridiales bacterium]